MTLHDCRRRFSSKKYHLHGSQGQAVKQKQDLSVRSFSVEATSPGNENGKDNGNYYVGPKTDSHLKCTLLSGFFPLLNRKIFHITSFTSLRPGEVYSMYNVAIIAIITFITVTTSITIMITTTITIAITISITVITTIIMTIQPYTRQAHGAGVSFFDLLLGKLSSVLVSPVMVV